MTATEMDALLESTLPAGVWDELRSERLLVSLDRYMELLSKWGRVVSLTSVRSEEDVVRRHFAESLLCGWALGEMDSVLDLGSGAGFPGVPVQLVRPAARVCLAEAHARKAAFLREVVRELDLPTRVFAGRAQELEGETFGCVCLRAVDPMAQALRTAAR